MEKQVIFEFNKRRVSYDDKGHDVGLTNPALIEPATDKIFVSFNSGNDSNPGTEAQPVKTLYEALYIRTEKNIILLNDGIQEILGSVNLNGKNLYCRYIADEEAPLEVLDYNDIKLPLNRTDKNSWVQCSAQGITATGKISASYSEQTPGRTITTVSTSDFGAAITAAFPELIFNNIYTSADIYSGYVIVNKVKKQPTFYLQCSCPSAGFSSDKSVWVLIVCSSETLTPISYYWLKDIFNIYGVLSTIAVNITNGNPGFTPRQVHFIGDGSEYALFSKIGQSLGAGTPGKRQFVFIKSKSIPSDPNFKYTIETPEILSANIDYYDSRNSNNTALTGLLYCQYNDIGTPYFSKNILYSDLFSAVVAAGSWGSLSSTYQNLLKNDFYNQIIFYCGKIQKYTLIYDLYLPYFPFAEVEESFRHNPLLQMQNGFMRISYYNGGFFNPFNFDLGYGVKDSTGLIKNTLAAVDSLFFNGNLFNIKFSIKDFAFTVNEYGQAEGFFSRVSNYLSILSNGLIQNCQFTGSMDSRQYNTNIYSGGAIIQAVSHPGEPNTGERVIFPDSAAGIPANIENSIINKFNNGSFYVPYEGAGNFSLIKKDLKNNIFLFVGCGSIFFTVNQCSFLFCENASDGSNEIKNSIIALCRGQYITRLGLVLRNCIVQEGAAAGLLHPDQSLNPDDFFINSLLANPYFKSTIQPFNLRLQAKIKGDYLDSPALHFSAIDSSHAGAGKREAGAYDDNAQLFEIYEKFSIIAPWVAPVKGERQSKQNVLIDGSKPSFAFSKQFLDFKLQWSLHITQAERQQIFRLLNAESTEIRFYPNPIRKPDLYLLGFISPKTDYTSEKAIVDKISNSLFLEISFAAPDNSKNINDYL